MEIQQLRYVVAAAKERSYAAAARGCFTTRQNISRSIGSLEAELSVTIFERHGNVMYLTPAGEIVAERAQQVLDLVDGLMLELQSPADQASQLNLAISSNLFAGVNNSIITAVDRYSRQGHFSEMSCEECYEGVINGTIDAALVTAMTREFPECTALNLGTSAPFLLVGENSVLASRSSFSLEDLKNVKFSLMSAPPFQYLPLIKFLESVNYSPQNVTVITSTSSMIHYIKRGDVAAIVTERMAAASPEGTVAIPVIDPLVEWNLYALFKKNSPAYPVVIELIKQIRAAFPTGSSF